jgi:hypothetical protein
MNNPKLTPLGGIIGVLLFVGFGASGRRLSFLAWSRPAEIHVDEIHKNRRKRNGGGTFRFLGTLKKHDVKNAAEDCGLSWRTDYD